MSDILVIGKGFLGNAVENSFSSMTNSITSTNYSNLDDTVFLDITDLKHSSDIIKKINPSVIVNCAARTDLDFLEEHPDIAFSVNSKGVENLSKICKENYIKLIHISTDSVFDGIRGMYDESEIPNPVNVYAQSKLEGENKISSILDDFVIVRTNFYGLHNENKFLFNWIFNSLKENLPIVGFDDVIFNPLEINNLSNAIVELSQNSFSGIIHLSSDYNLSKFEFAQQICKYFDFDTNLITPKSIETKIFKAKRPKNTTLKNLIAKKLLKTKFNSLNEWLMTLKKDLLIN